MNRLRPLCLLLALATGPALAAVPAFIGDQQFGCVENAGSGCEQYLPDGGLVGETVVESTFTVPTVPFCARRSISVLVLGLHGAPTDLQLRVRHAPSGTDVQSAEGAAPGIMGGEDLERVVALPGFPAGSSPAGLWRLNVEDRHGHDYGHLLDWRVVLDCLIPKVLTAQSGPDPLLGEPGETLRYTISLKNDAPWPVTVPVSDPIPPGTSFVAASNGGTLAGSTVSWNATVPADSTLDLTLDVLVGNPVPLIQTVISNRATIGGEQSCESVSNAAVCDPTRIIRRSDLFANGFE